MAFLGKIRGMLGSGSELEQQEEPVRARTFSASQFRDQELARAAEARARLEAMQIDAAAVLSPTINPVALSNVSGGTDGRPPTAYIPSNTSSSSPRTTSTTARILRIG